MDYLCDSRMDPALPKFDSRIMNHHPDSSFVLQTINLTTHALFLSETSRSKATSKWKERERTTPKGWCQAGSSYQFVWDKRVEGRRCFDVYGESAGKCVGYHEAEDWMGEMVVAKRRRKGWKKVIVNRPTITPDGEPMNNEKSSLLASSNHPRQHNRPRLLAYIKYVSASAWLRIHIPSQLIKKIPFPD